MNKEKQTEEMANIISNSIKTWANELPPISNPHFVAINLYNAGYRKQSENVIEIVRCKDCRHRNPCGYKCLRDNLWHDDDDFCSRGER